MSLIDIDKLLEVIVPDQKSTDKKKQVGLYAGGFKPPTSGHFKVVMKALRDNPDLDELKILIGNKDRDGVTQAQSMLIWDIYKKYLPFKVTLEPVSKPPVKAVYNYAKENPDEDVDWILGAREGNEDDFKDIATRTTAADNYPNLTVRTTITDSGASGTAARNAFKVSQEKLEKLLPKKLDQLEKDEVFKILTRVDESVNEGDTYEKMAAKGKKAGNLKQGTVRKRLNIPKGEKIPLTKIKKEISRIKKMENPSEKNKKYLKALNLAKTLKTTTNLNEVLNPATFDYKPIIASLTKSMEKDGLNLQPYPTVRFIHDEEANADDFFGKTAYYDPNNKEVVLYTLGRHPKDIMRSYAHELVHVHQDNEDRLHNVQTTDVNADEYLEQLEREAYETGNILFRSWTDSLTDGILSEGKKKGYKHKYGFNPKLGKDPFGLNAYARELALGLEEQESDYKVYLDMDGVIANFDQRFEDISGMKPHEFESKYGKKAFWNLIDEDNKISFWVGIKPMPGAKALVDYVKKYNYELLTSPSSKKQSYLGKILWVRNNSGILGGKPRINFKKAKEKHQIKNNLSQSDILIDDRMDTIERWNNAGGTGIHYESASQVLNDLKKLGL